MIITLVCAIIKKATLRRVVTPIRRSVDMSRAEQIKALEERLKNLKQKEATAQRKARTKRLIERGAELEKILGTDYDYEKFFDWLRTKTEEKK